MPRGRCRSRRARRRAASTSRSCAAGSARSPRGLWTRTAAWRQSGTYQLVPRGRNADAVIRGGLGPEGIVRIPNVVAGDYYFWAVVQRATDGVRTTEAGFLPVTVNGVRRERVAADQRRRFAVGSAGHRRHPADAIGYGGREWSVGRESHDSQRTRRDVRTSSGPGTRRRATGRSSRMGPSRSPRARPGADRHDRRAGGAQGRASEAPSTSAASRSSLRAPNGSTTSSS